jgi:hypothetical protein
MVGCWPQTDESGKRKTVKIRKLVGFLTLVALTLAMAALIFFLTGKPVQPTLLYEDSGSLAMRRSDVRFFNGDASAAVVMADNGYEFQGAVLRSEELLYVRNSAQHDDGDNDLVETDLMLGNELVLESTQVTPRWYLPRVSPQGNQVAVIGEERTAPTDTIIFDSVLQSGVNLVQALGGLSDNSEVASAAAELFNVDIRDQHIYVLNLSTGNLVRLPRPNGTFWGYTPVWVSDSSLIYVVDTTYAGPTDNQLVLVTGIGTSVMMAQIIADGSDPDVYGEQLLFRRDGRTYRLNLNELTTQEATPLVDGVCGRWATNGAFYTVVHQGNLYAVRTAPNDGNNPTALTSHSGILATDDELTCPEPATDRIAYVMGSEWDQLELHVLHLQVTDTEVQPLEDEWVAWAVYGPFTWAPTGISLPKH